MPSPNQSIVKVFEGFVKECPELSVPVAAIKALTLHIQSSPAATMTEFTKDLEGATKDLLTATNHCIAVAAGCDLFRRFVNRTGSDQSEDIYVFKKRLIDRGQAFVDTKAPHVRDKIARYAMEFIQDDTLIIVHSYSRPVLNLLLKAAGEGNKRFRVLVTESRPSMRGTKAVQLLRQNNVNASLILDAAIGHYMGMAQAVLVGAEGVVENGGIVNQIGTFMVAVMAKAMNVPFYAVVESYKFVRWFPLGQYDLPSYQSGTMLFDQQGSSLLSGSGSGGANANSGTNLIEFMQADHPTVDYTPPAYISLLFTDFGVLTPSGVSDELIQFYNN